MQAMSSQRDDLIDATIGHLSELRRGGRRFISLSSESISILTTATKATDKPGATDNQSRKSPGARSSLSAAFERELAAGRAPAKNLSPTMPSMPKPSPTSPPPAARSEPIIVAPLSPEVSVNKLEALRDLRERARACMKCANLAAARTNVVFGVGSPEAEIMFVGEAPGADEDLQGEPFVGAAGQLLTKIIQTMGLSRETVYIANILKCRPDTPGQASGNRKPTSEEMKTCIPYLHSQIDVIQPKVLVALGATAVEGLLGAIGGITRVRGTWREYRGIPLMPTFHPAYLLRNMALSEKRKVWEDMLQVMEKLGMPISEKQRMFFLPKSS